MKELEIKLCEREGRHLGHEERRKSVDEVNFGTWQKFKENLEKCRLFEL